MGEETQKEISKHLQKLAKLQSLVDSYDEEIPYQLSKQIEVLSEIQGIIGRLHAEAVHDFKKARADRKAAEGVLALNTTGTGVEKEAASKQGSHKARLLEAEAESEAMRWKNAFISQDNLIQAKKKTLEVLKDELRQGK